VNNFYEKALSKTENFSCKKIQGQAGHPGHLEQIVQMAYPGHPGQIA
jgi:hypothetical protein